MSTTQNTLGRMSSYCWTICTMLFFATTANYLGRQVLSLTWDKSIKLEFRWDESHYGTITAVLSLVYVTYILFAGHLVDQSGFKKGYSWAIDIWSLGACMRALCGVITEHSIDLHSAVELTGTTGDVAVTIVIISMYCFLGACRMLALGRAENFPAAIKVTIEHLPGKDHAYVASILNAGISIGTPIAPLPISLLAKAWGWEMTFIVIGGLGFIQMGFWVFMYAVSAKSKHVNKIELERIEQDSYENVAQTTPQTEEKKMSFQQCFGYKQTWAFAIGKFMTDGVWWLFLFWIPSYLNTQLGIKISDGLDIALIFTLYAITMLSIYGGELPSIIIKKIGLNPYAARMHAMSISAFFPLLILLTQPLGTISPWFPVTLIGIDGAAYQSWSANIFSTVDDMLPKTAIATITGIDGMAGGISYVVLQYTAGRFFVYAGETNMAFMGFGGRPAGYFVIFCVCVVAYLIGWCIVKALVPKYKPIVLN